MGFVQGDTGCMHYGLVVAVSPKTGGVRFRWDGESDTGWGKGREWWCNLSHYSQQRTLPQRGRRVSLYLTGDGNNWISSWRYEDVADKIEPAAEVTA